jgi:mRNA-degrading endonuclease toxin of MazEF toxin-antitoxin module
MYNQGDIIAVYYPLTDKPAKTKLRPAIVVSSSISNQLDNDILVCPITSKIRGDEFSFLLKDEDLLSPLPAESEVRCNKIMTIRAWEKQIVGKISQVNHGSLSGILQLVQKVFSQN